MWGKSFVIIFLYFALAGVLLFSAQTHAQKKDPPQSEGAASKERNKKQPDRILYQNELEDQKNCPNLKTISVRAILRANGKVTDIEVEQESLKGLSEKAAKSLSAKCKKAASQIKFKPAMKNGRPASQHVKIEYTICLKDSNQKGLDKEEVKPNNSFNPSGMSLPFIENLSVSASCAPG